MHAREQGFRVPLEYDARRLAASLSESEGEAVLLGSIATSKYVDPLLAALGDKLLSPPDFVGRGDMSRGSILLRRIEEGIELRYAALRGAVRHSSGARAP